MTIKLEIHAPGLDLHHERWNHHILFMDKVHEHVKRVAACAWHHFETSGRGALFVDRNHWMTVIKDEGWLDDVMFPCRHIAAGSTDSVVDTAPLGAGFDQMIAEYDPDRETILVVEHHPGDQLSSYFIETTPGPPDAYVELKKEIDRLMSG